MFGHRETFVFAHSYFSKVEGKYSLWSIELVSELGAVCD